MAFFLPIVVAFTCFVVFLTVIFQPKLCWPLLIIISVGTAGLVLFGYALIDELLLGSLLVGVMGAVVLRRINFKRESQEFWHSLHEWIFFLFVGYMIFQGVRGFWLRQDFLIIRWIIFYLILGALVFLLSREAFSYFDRRKSILIISGSAFLYSLAYLFHGVFSELVRGVNRFALQGFEWSGTSYAVFPIVIASASAIFLLREKVLNYRLLGAAFLILGIIVSVYYNSRVSLLPILIFIAVFLFISNIPRRKKIVLLIVFFLIAFILIWLTAQWTLKNYYGILFGGEQKYEVWAKQGGDIDRYIHFRSALGAVNENWKTFLFGHGLYSHRSVLVPYLQEITNRYRIDVTFREPVRTEAFGALLVDTGWVGLLVFSMNFFIVAFIIFPKNKNPDKFILFLAVFISFFWLFVSNILDIVLLYLLVMPSGLILQLNRDEKIISNFTVNH